MASERASESKNEQNQVRRRDFVQAATACPRFASSEGSADGLGCADPSEVRPTIEVALRSPRAALVEAVVEPDQAPLKPEELKS